MPYPMPVFIKNMLTPSGDYYFVSSTGYDSNSGKSMYSPWRTVAKVNASFFNPNDSVLFKCGETWTGTQLTVPSSGRSGRPITYGSYGSGALPILTGPNAAAYIIYMTGKHDLVFQDLDLSCAAGDWHLLFIDTGYNITVQRNTIHGAGTSPSYGIWARGQSTNTYNIIIDGNTVYSCKENGIAVSNPTGYSDIPSNCTVSNNLVHDNGTSTAADHGIYINANNCRVYGNNCYDNKGAGIKLNSAVNCMVERNKSYGTTLGLQMDGFFMGKEANPAINSGNVLRNNIVYNCVYGIYYDVVATANYWYHNTIINSSNAAKTSGYGLRMGTGCANQVFKNNLIFQDHVVIGTFKAAYRIVTATDVDNNTWNYNAARCTDTARFAEVGAAQKTFAEWQGLGGTPDINGVNGDPVFVTNYTDLHLQAGSPCIGTGDPNVPVPDDFDGKLRGTPVDIGAYEFA